MTYQGRGLPLPGASSKRIWYTQVQQFFHALYWGIALYMPRILGITGNIACGKTAVGQMLVDMGAECYIDADAVVHRLYLSGQPIENLADAPPDAHHFNLADLYDAMGEQ